MVKGFGEVDLPDGMSQEQMRMALRQMYPTSARQSATDALTPVQEVDTYEPTLSEMISSGIGETLYDTGIVSDRYRAMDTGRSLGDIASYIPPVAAAIAGDAFGRELKQGDYLGAAGSAIEGALEANPIANTVGTGLTAGLMGLKKAGEKTTRAIGDISDRFMSGYGKTAEGLGRKGEKQIIESTTLGETLFGGNPDSVSIFDLEGKPFVTVPYDRSSINRGITSINDKELNYPIETEGGMGYLLNPDSDFSAASEKAVINKMIKARNKAAEITGSDDVLFIPHSMGQTGVDHSTMPLEVMFAYAGTNLSKKNQRELNKKIKAVIPDFAGVDNPESLTQISNITGAKRKQLLKVVDKYRDMGGLSVPQARAIITDPEQMNIDDLRAINVATMDKQLEALPTDDHSTYKFGIKGKPVGKLQEDLEITDLLSTNFNQDNKDLFEKDRVWRALQMKPYMGQITDKVLRNLEKDAPMLDMPAMPRSLFDELDSGASDFLPVNKAPGLTVGKGYVPQRTQKAYKLFRTKDDGELYPLFVDADTKVKTGEWVDAISGDRGNKGKVKSKLGDLAYRPGWHAGDSPSARHIGGKALKGSTKPEYRPADQVWAEVEMPADVDWQTEALNRAATTKAGKPLARTAHITDQVPFGGNYRYKTNPNMVGEWIISGNMKVNDKIDPNQVAQIGAELGNQDLPSLDRFIADKGITKLSELTGAAQKELKKYYPEVYESLK